MKHLWRKFQQWLENQREEDEDYEWRQGFMYAIEQRLFHQAEADDLMMHAAEQILEPYWTGVIAGAKYELTTLNTTWRIH